MYRLGGKGVDLRSSRNGRSGSVRRKLWYRLAVMMLLVGSNTVFAQQTGANTPLPDAPSASTAPKPEQQRSIGFVNLLEGRSRVFPNLAVNTKPLTPPQKLGLAARNSISLYTIVGSGIAAGYSQAIDSYSGYGQGAEGTSEYC